MQLKPDLLQTPREKLEISKLKQAQALREFKSQLHRFKTNIFLKEKSEHLRNTLRLQHLEQEYDELLEQKKEQKELTSARLRNVREKELRAAELRVRMKLSESIVLARKMRDRTGLELECGSTRNSPRTKESREEVKHVLVKRGDELLRLHILGENSESPKRVQESPKRKSGAHIKQYSFSEKVEELPMTASLKEEAIAPLPHYFSSIDPDLEESVVPQSEPFPEMTPKEESREALYARMHTYWRNRVKPDFPPKISFQNSLECQLRTHNSEVRKRLHTIKRIPLQSLIKPT